MHRQGRYREACTPLCPHCHRQAPLRRSGDAHRSDVRLATVCWSKLPPLLTGFSARAATIHIRTECSLVLYPPYVDQPRRADLPFSCPTAFGGDPIAHASPLCAVRRRWAGHPKMTAPPSPMSLLSASSTTPIFPLDKKIPAQGGLNRTRRGGLVLAHLAKPLRFSLHRKPPHP